MSKYSLIISLFIVACTFNTITINNHPSLDSGTASGGSSVTGGFSNVLSTGGTGSNLTSDESPLCDESQSPLTFWGLNGGQGNTRRTIFSSWQTCATLSHWGNDKFDMWMYNANDNADAYGSLFGLMGACENDSICAGAPARCGLWVTYVFPNIWPPTLDIKVANLECTNMFNCSGYGHQVLFGSDPDPHDCCVEILF